MTFMINIISITEAGVQVVELFQCVRIVIVWHTKAWNPVRSSRDVATSSAAVPMSSSTPLYSKSGNLHPPCALLCLQNPEGRGIHWLLGSMYIIDTVPVGMCCGEEGSAILGYASGGGGFWGATIQIQRMRAPFHIMHWWWEYSTLICLILD